MNRPLLFFMLSFKRLFRKPSFLAILLLLPLCSFLLSRYEREAETGVKAALYVTDGDVSDGASPENMARKLSEDLLAREGTVRFYLCEDEESLIRDVVSKKADCGYLIPSDLGERIQNNRMSGAIPVLVSPASSVMPVSNEILSASLQEQYARIVLKQTILEDDHLKDAGLSPGDLAARADSLFETFLTDGGTFSFDYSQTASPVRQSDAASSPAPAGNGKEVRNAGYLTAPLRGVTAVLVFLAALSGVLNDYRDRERRIYAASPRRIRLLMPCMTVLAAALAAGAAGLFCLALSGLWSGFVRELSGMLVYAVSLTAYCLFLRLFLRDRLSYGAAAPVLLLASLLLCPVFLDLSVFSPVFSMLSRLFPPSWYLALFPA